MSEYKIIDISGRNDNLQYSKLNKLGIAAAILRITEKNNKKDSLFDKHLQGLKQNNVPILGGYKFSYALSLDEIIQEANQVVNTLKKYPDFNNKVVYLDLQYSEQERLSKKTLTSFIKAFEQVIKNAGYKFGIYCNTNWYQNLLDTSNLPYDYWLAAYPYNDIGQVEERLRPNKKGQIGWQYTSHFPVGFQECDMSLFNKSYVDNILKIQSVMEEPASNPINVPNSQNVKEKAISFMENIARDNSHGYSQDSRWGQPDYDCSSLVIRSWEQAGVPVESSGATYTGNMYNIFLRNGFVDVTNQVNLNTGEGLLRSDVLLNHTYHTAMYCGNGLEVQASINEKGGAHNSIPGDQTGQQILIRSYRNYPWNVVLRYMSGETPPSILIKKGTTGEDIVKLQKMLIKCGYSCGSYGADGDFGEKTEQALKRFQADFNLEVDGIYGPKSKEKLQQEYKKYPKKIKLIKTGYIREGASSKKKILKTLKVNTILIATKKIVYKGGGEWYKTKDGYINAHRVEDI